jgi:peptide/nickel transport system substrate-binding protein
VANVGEIAVNNLAAVGIKLALQPIERAAFYAGYAAKKYRRGVIQAGSGAFGNAATRLAAFVVKGGAFAYGSYPDIDALFAKQNGELDPKQRAAILARVQQLVSDKAIYAPLWQLGFLNGTGPRVDHSSFGAIAGFPYTAPYEDIMIKTAAVGLRK